MQDKQKIKIIAIVGQTGSGKTALSINIAKKFSGEIINADSRAIYKDCDIATAKPTKEEQDGIPHHFFDIVKPDEVYTVSQYKFDAEKKIQEIVKRKKLPIIVGGTGLYFDALLFGFNFPPKGDEELRVKLEKLSIDELLKKLDTLDPDALNEIDRKNKRRIIRALEVCILTNKKFSSFKTKKQTNFDVLWIGIKWNSEKLKERLSLRADKMLESGVLEETKNLIKKYPQAFAKNFPAITSIGYPIWKRYLDGEITLDQAKQLFVFGDWHLARKQALWWKKNTNIYWLEPNNATKQSRNLIDRFIL